MTNEFKGTKGKFKAEFNGVYYEVKEVIEYPQTYRGDICSVHHAENIHGITKAEQVANAHLIVEAFNVVNSTGLTPNQLVEQNKELLEACKRAEKHHQGLHSEIGSILRNAIANAEK